MNQPHSQQPQAWASQAPPGHARPGYAQPGAPPTGGSYPQQAQAAPGYAYPGQPQAGPAGAGQSGMVLTTKYHPMAFLLGLFQPAVVLNGRPIQARWGRMELPMPPGQYHLHVHTRYFMPSQLGKADTVVPVSPGHIVEVEYRAPLWALSAGSLGPVPQRYNGVAATVGVCAAVIVLGVLLGVLQALA